MIRKRKTLQKKNSVFYESIFYNKKTPKAGADFYLAGVERIELPSKVLETPMLPLYHTPVDVLIIA